MAIPLTPDTFYDMALDFAQTALVAHHARKNARVALNAGTAIEHLAKACLATRSPALLVDLSGDRNFASLLRLLGISEGKTPQPLRTVGLRGAHERAKRFVTSTASDHDLGILIGMRDGTVHAAQDDEVEERLVVAFVQYADAVLADLGRDRAAFWGGQLDVVDALLADASDKVAHRVGVKLAQALAAFERRYGEEPPEMLGFVRGLALPHALDGDQALADCPACESLGVADGEHEVEWGVEDDGSPVGTVWFNAAKFACRVCGLQLERTELEPAAMKSRWEVEGADPAKFEPYTDDAGYEGEAADAAYEAWREDNRPWKE
jgi:hypothetical protein